MEIGAEDVTVGDVVSGASLVEMGTSVDTSDVSNVSGNDDQ